MDRAVGGVRRGRVVDQHGHAAELFDRPVDEVAAFVFVVEVGGAEGDRSSGRGDGFDHGLAPRQRFDR